jgi:hypothetical protein
MISIAGVVFWLSLESYLAFVYPLAVFTGAVPVGMINQVTVDYYLSINGLGSEGARLIPTLLGVVALITALLPERIDPIYRLQLQYRRWSAER